MQQSPNSVIDYRRRRSLAGKRMRTCVEEDEGEEGGGGSGRVERMNGTRQSELESEV